MYTAMAHRCIVLAFPARIDAHLAKVNYEQAEQHYSEILDKFDAREPNYWWWFQNAQQRRERARDLMVAALC